MSNASEAPGKEISLEPVAGWHCRHYFYRFRRSVLRTLGPSELTQGCRQFVAALDPASKDAPARLQTFAVSGHKADFGVLLLDADPLRCDGVHQQLASGLLGPALRLAWSFVSITEVSEYLPDEAEVSRQLAEQGLDPNDEEFLKRIRQFRRRLEIMHRQRLNPDLPTWPAVCFYPMNRLRIPQANWFLLPLKERKRMMAEHGQSGMEFAGKVTQLITASTGLDDWEWGVTLWAANPQYLKEVVYRMRFDEASARYAEFGPFYSGYLQSAEEILAHCRVDQPR